jgi:hypothetical protein
LLRKFRFNPLRGQLVSQSPLPYRKREVKRLAGTALFYVRLNGWSVLKVKSLDELKRLLETGLP